MIALIYIVFIKYVFTSQAFTYNYSKNTLMSSSSQSFKTKRSKSFIIRFAVNDAKDSRFQMKTLYSKRNSIHKSSHLYDVRIYLDVGD